MTSTTTRGLLYSSLHRFNNALENLESFQKEKDIIFYILPSIEGSFDIISHSVSWGSGEGYILSPARNRQKFQIMKIHNFEGSIIPEDIWTKIDSISLEDFVGRILKNFPHGLLK